MLHQEITHKGVSTANNSHHLLKNSHLVEQLSLEVLNDIHCRIFLNDCLHAWLSKKAENLLRWPK